MHMISIRRAFAGIGAGLALLAFSLTPDAQAAPHTPTPNPRVTVDLRQLPHGNCWFEVSWLNTRHTQTSTEPICPPAAPRVTGDCARVAAADRALCNTVRAQHAYGWTDDVGNPQNWNADGRALVHDITHQGYTKGEMHDALTAAHRDYRDNVTNITFNLDKLTRTCGHTHGAYGVQYIQGDDGHLYTWVQTICD